MSKLKSLLIMLLSLVMVLSLTACGNNEGTSSNQGGDSSGTTEVMTVPDELVGTTVKYATWINEYEVESGPVITNFMNETGINVELVTIPQHEYLQKLSAMVASDQAPDVFRETSEWPRLLQIAQPITNAGIDVTDKLWDQSIVNFGTVGGKPYLVNSVGSIWSERNMVVYNKEIFEENAITTPHEYIEADNWTWDTFYKCMQDVKNSGYEYGGFIDLDYFANSVGAQMITYENGVFKNSTSDPKLQDAFVYVARASKEGLIDFGLSVGSIASEKCGIAVTTSYDCKASGRLSGMDADKIGYVYMPKYDKNQKEYTSSAFPLAWGLVDGASNPIGAGYFLTYFLDVENYKKAGCYDSAFKSEDAKKFYEEITSKGYTEGAGYIYVTHGAAQLISESGKYYLENNARKADPLQVPTELKSVSNKVDAVVEAANDVIQKTIEKNK